MEKFTPEEEKLLSPFVTNLYDDIFVLRNLPEVIKGALFSRYSRTKKGVRRLLLDEFILNKEIGFQNVVSFTEETGGDQTLAIKKAKTFYDRILDGYGDDSIGELGAAHVAIENISNMATKVIQDARIGGSPLEKSSRYVWFNKKINGEYMFYKDPVLMSSEFATDYIELMNLLFGTYEELIAPMKEYFIKLTPKDPDTPEQAYKFSIRARACDAIRGLLPCSTFTNMGVLGNGRFFEYLILKLRCHPLTEMHQIADQLQKELNKVIPSFVRRCHPEHKHFAPAQQFSVHGAKEMVKIAEEMLGDEPRETHDEVELIDYDPLAEDKVLATLLYASTTQPLHHIRRVVKNMGLEQRKKILDEFFRNRTNRRHKPPRAFENAYYTFDFLADFGIYRDLQRHRMLTQERQDLTTAHGYITPDAIIDAGFKEKWDHCMMLAAKLHRRILEKYPKEAQYVVPFAYKIRWYFTINARSLYWFSELRSGAGGHPNYRRVAQKMYSLAKSTHPFLFEYCKYVDMNDYSLGRLQSEVRIAQKGIVKREDD